MDLGCRGECPAFLPTAVDNFGDLIGQLFVNAAIGLGFEFTFGDGRRSAMRARAFGDRKTSGQIGYLVDEFPVRVGDIEGLDQFYPWPGSWRFVDLIRYQAAATCHYDACSSFHIDI